jgi:hypothetical protein
MLTRQNKYKSAELIGKASASALGEKNVCYSTGNYDIDALLRGDQEFFFEPNLGAAEQKKKIIVTDWSYQYGLGDDNAKAALQQLMRDQFEVYVWNGELTKVPTPAALDFYLGQIRPIRRDELNKKLPALNKEPDQCFIADYTRMRDTIRSLAVDPAKVYLKIDNLWQKIPLDEMEELLATIPECDQVTARIERYDSNKISAARMAIFRKFIEAHKCLHVSGNAAQQRLDGLNWACLQSL